MGSRNRGDSPDEPAIKRLSVRQQEEYDDATRCYIIRHEFVEGEAKCPKVCSHDHIMGWFIGAAHRSVTWSAR